MYHVKLRQDEQAGPAIAGDVAASRDVNSSPLSADSGRSKCRNNVFANWHSITRRGFCAAPFGRDWSHEARRLNIGNRHSDDLGKPRSGSGQDYDESGKVTFPTASLVNFPS
jgi:hypothetical protein